MTNHVRQEAGRFVLGHGEDEAELTYRREGEAILFDHTAVPRAMQHHGLAATLARAALDFARDHHLRVIPACPFVADFLEKHPEYQPLLEAR